MSRVFHGTGTATRPAAPERRRQRRHLGERGRKGAGLEGCPPPSPLHHHHPVTTTPSPPPSHHHPVTTTHPCNHTHTPAHCQILIYDSQRHVTRPGASRPITDLTTLNTQSMHPHPQPTQSPRFRVEHPLANSLVVRHITEPQAALALVSVYRGSSWYDHCPPYLYLMRIHACSFCPVPDGHPSPHTHAATKSEAQRSHDDTMIHSSPAQVPVGATQRSRMLARICPVKVN